MFEEVLKLMTQLFENNVCLICQIKTLSNKTRYLEVLILAGHVTASPQKGELKKTDGEH